MPACNETCLLLLAVTWGQTGAEGMLLAHVYHLHLVLVMCPGPVYSAV